MNSMKPFIVKFATKKGNKYIYDVTTNSIFPGDDLTLEILYNFKKMNRDKLIDYLSLKFPRNQSEKNYNKVLKWIKFEDAFFPPSTVS